MSCFWTATGDLETPVMTYHHGHPALENERGPCHKHPSMVPDHEDIITYTCIYCGKQAGPIEMSHTMWRRKW